MNSRINKLLKSFCIFLFTIVLNTSFFCNAQITEKDYPKSYYIPKLKSTIEIPVYKLKILDTIALMHEDSVNSGSLRYSIFEEINIDIKEEGVNTKLDDVKGEIWRYNIENKETKSIQLYFKKYYIPFGANLFIYNENYSHIYGAFTSKNNSIDSVLMIADFIGNKVTLEYYEPYNTEFEGKLIIGSIGQAYKDLFKTISSIDTDGYIGINCPEGEDWQEQKHSVCIYTFQEGNEGYICSGALINNTRNDGTPYFLTACHCVDNSLSASSVVAYFNYEQLGCNGILKYENLTLSGASLISTGKQSDYSLLLFNNDPLEEYQPYFSGWDISDRESPTSVGIHHPNGETKKISLSYSPVISYDESLQWENNTLSPSNSHWKVYFDMGQTFQGSSGSPLFDDKKRIIGQLHGGDDVYDFYGKLKYSWTKNTKPYNTLKHYLDPDDTGIETIDGYYPVTNAPDPQFYAELTQACISAPFKFTAFSAFDPQTWSWSFDPNNITFHDSTNLNSKNPVVSFNTPGTYDVTLSASNNAGANTININDLISVGDSIDLEITPLFVKDSCLCNFDSLLLLAYGANKYKWFFNNDSTGNFYLENDTTNMAIIKLKENIATDSINIMVTLNGAHGTCFTSTTYSFPLIGQINDNIENAVLITDGTNGIFSNKCAGIQENEPEPDHSSCTGQNSWCDEYNTGENIVENSVWFYFLPSSNDDLQIRSTGFDNQIAIYEAESADDILNGLYSILGANDDLSINDYNPCIEKISVEKGKTYWVQVDGSAGGSEGEFYLYLEINGTISIEKTTTQVDNDLHIYPQPSTNYLILESDLFTRNQNISIEIYNLTGRLIYSDVKSNSSSSTIKLDISDWNKGIYIMKIIVDGNTSSYKIIK